MNHPVPIDAPGGSATARASDLESLLPGNAGALIDGVLDGAQRTAGIDRARVEALIHDLFDQYGPGLYRYVLGGMGLSISAAVQSTQRMIDAASDLTLVEIAQMLKELPSQALDALGKAKRLLVDPAFAGAARELGDAIGEAVGTEIDFGATSARHFMQQYGRIAGVVMIEVWLAAITRGASMAALETRWGRRLVETAKSVWQRLGVLPGGGRDRHATRSAERGTSSADRGTDDTGLSADARGTGDRAGAQAKGERVDAASPRPHHAERAGPDAERGATEPERSTSEAERAGPGAERVESGEDRDATADDDDDLETWTSDFERQLAQSGPAPVPEVRRPQRFEGDEDRFDLPPPRARFDEVLDGFTKILNGIVGENARHPAKWKKDGDYTKHYASWKGAVNTLQRQRAEMFTLIRPGMVLNPDVPAHRERLEKIAALRKEARETAGARYAVFQSRFWRQVWDNPHVRGALLEPAYAADSAFAERIAGRSLKAVWDDVELRNKVLETFWGIRWNKRGQAPKSRVVRQVGPENKLVEWVPLELDHLVRQADNPFLALDHRNLNVTTKLINQRLMEAIRRLSREATTDAGAFESGGLAASSRVDRDIEQFLLANRDGLRAVAGD